MAEDVSIEDSLTVKKKRGRPVGSKNKPRKKYTKRGNNRGPGVKRVERIEEERALEESGASLDPESLYELGEDGRLMWADNGGVGQLFADTTGGLPGEVERIVADEGKVGLMRRILTDSGGLIRVAILAKALRLGFAGDGNQPWMRLALKIIETSIAEGVGTRGGAGRNARIPISAGLALEITAPVRGLLRDVDEAGEENGEGEGGE